jgi:hypothetical protein
MRTAVSAPAEDPYKALRELLWKLLFMKVKEINRRLA